MMNLGTTPRACRGTVEFNSLESHSPQCHLVQSYVFARFQLFFSRDFSVPSSVSLFHLNIRYIRIRVKTMMYKVITWSRSQSRYFHGQVWRLPSALAFTPDGLDPRYVSLSQILSRSAAVQFCQNVRNYNNAFAFSSLDVKIDSSIYGPRGVYMLFWSRWWN